MTDRIKETEVKYQENFAMGIPNVKYWGNSPELAPTTKPF